MPSQSEALARLDQATTASITNCPVGLTTIPADANRRGVVITCTSGFCYIQFGGNANQLTSSSYACKLASGDVYELMMYSGVTHVLCDSGSLARVTSLGD